MSQKKKPSADPWVEVKTKCRLNESEIQMAKQLGLNPRKLIANQASRKDEPWKEPLSDWVRDVYEKRFKK